MSQYTIDQGTASTLTTEYRGNHEGQTKGFKIDKAEIDQIFADHPEATCFRAYLGQQPNAGKLQLVMVAVDAAGNDILDIFYDKTLPCPSDCGDANFLNDL